MRAFFLCLSILSISACGFKDFELHLFSCESYVPQHWQLGGMGVAPLTGQPALKVGDKLRFKFRIPKTLTDTLGQDLVVDRGCKVFVKISTTLNLSDTTAAQNPDFFAVDTTIFHVFDQYFSAVSKKGTAENAYTYNAELVGDFWEIETEYTAKKPGNYWARLQLQQLDASQADLEKYVCREGDPEAFGATLFWESSENNRIDLLFNDDKDKYPEYYGFIINP